MIAPLLALALAAATPEVDAGPAISADAGLDAGVLATIDDAGALDDAGSGSEIVDAGVIPLVEEDAGFDVDAGPIATSVEPLPQPQAIPLLDFSTPTNFRFSGEFRSKLLIDTNFESRPGEPLAENVAELQSWVNFGAQADFGDHAHAVAEVRARHRAVEQRSPPGEFFWLFNGQNPKATLEVYAGESYVDLYTHYVDFRIGNQVLAFGANTTGAPADVMNPLDIREGIFFADDPSDVKLPVPAIRARGTVYDFDWMVAWAPFFVPDRYDLYGQDEALIQPALGAAVPAIPLLTVAQQDRAEQPLIETDRPLDTPQNGDIGLRVTHKLGPTTLGIDYVISREKIPEVIVDPELARFLAEGPGANFSDPATALSLQQRVASGEQLLHGTFPRFAVGEVEASTLVGPAQIDVDVGHSASRLFVDSNLNPVFHPLSTAEVTAADARGTQLTLAASVVAIWIHDIPQGERLAILDRPGAEDSAHQTLGGFVALLAGYRTWQNKLEGEVRGYLDPRQGSYAVGVRGAWNESDRVHVLAGYQRFQGPAESPFGYFRRNDAVWGGIRLDL